MTKRALAATVMILAATAAGAHAAPRADRGPTDPDITSGKEQQRLDHARVSWRASGVTSYRFRVRLECFCPTEITRPRTIHVRHGRPVGTVPEHLRDVATIVRLHRRIQRAIAKGAASLEVRYGPLGIPHRIAIDPEAMIADEESYYTVDHFVRDRPQKRRDAR